MFNKLHRDESGQTALETAIILIAFIVVASVFAFTILSAGSASTEAGEEAIYSGLEGVQSSMDVRGTIMAEAADNGSGTMEVQNIRLRLTLVAGGQPVDLTPGGDVVISYRDNDNFVNSLTYTLDWAGASDTDSLLEADEQADLTIDVSGTGLEANTEFNLEIVPPDGAVLAIELTTPAALETWNSLR